MIGGQASILMPERASERQDIPLVGDFWFLQLVLYGLSEHVLKEEIFVFYEYPTARRFLVEIVFLIVIFYCKS